MAGMSTQPWSLPFLCRGKGPPLRLWHAHQGHRTRAERRPEEAVVQVEADPLCRRSRAQLRQFIHAVSPTPLSEAQACP